MAPRRVSNHAAQPLITELTEFQGSNFRGEKHTPGFYVYTGRLPGRWAETLGQADYVVFSYSTPIAWHLPDGWVVPPVTYSTSTAKHQGIVRSAALHYWSSHHRHPGWVLGLTRTQSDALDSLRSAGKLWPIFKGEGDYARRTLQVLVDKGLARWVTRDGVMPYVESAEED